MMLYITGRGHLCKIHKGRCVGDGEPQRNAVHVVPNGMRVSVSAVREIRRRAQKVPRNR